MRKLLIILSIFLSYASSAFAQKFEVIPPRNVIAGNTFYVTYRLTDGEGSSLNAPPVQNCKLLSQRPGVSTTQSMQMINGVTTSSVTRDYTFTYRAEKEGTFTIPAASIEVNGKKLTTREASFKVLPPDKNAASRQQNQGYGSAFDDFDTPAASSSSNPISKDDIFVRVILNKSNAYEGEAIECTLKLYTKYERINSFMMTAPPTFDGFLIDEIPTQAQLNEVEHYNGQNYITAVLKKCLIFPQKSGKLTIHSGSYDLSVVQLERVSNGFFISARPVEREVKLRPFSQTVNITPLPQPQPANFTGAVGSFTFESDLSSTEPRTGEAIALRYIVTGKGNVKYLRMPKPEIPSEFEQYSPQTQENARVSGSTLTGTETVEYTLVPQSVGEFTIPAQEFVYFDLDSKQYRTLTSQAYTLKVAKGAGTTASAEQHDIQIKNTDILHIKTGAKHLSHNPVPSVRFWWYWAIYGLLIILAAGALLVYRRQLRRNADVEGRRISKANKTARKRLRAAEGFMKAHKSDEFYQETLRALWGYLSDKLNIPSSQLNRQTITETLQSRGASEELCAQVVSLLDDCEMARYTPGSSSDCSVEAVYRKASQTIDMLEKSRLSGK